MKNEREPRVGLSNSDRWTIYTLQRLFPNTKFGKHHYSYGWGDHLPMTPKQLRRAKKKAFRNNDWSIGIYTR